MIFIPQVDRASLRHAVRKSEIVAVNASGSSSHGWPPGATASFGACTQDVLAKPRHIDVETAVETGAATPAETTPHNDAT
jgi:hypothetical protein